MPGRDARMWRHQDSPSLIVCRCLSGPESGMKSMLARGYPENGRKLAFFILRSVYSSRNHRFMHWPISMDLVGKLVFTSMVWNLNIIVT